MGINILIILICGFVLFCKSYGEIGHRDKDRREISADLLYKVIEDLFDIKSENERLAKKIEHLEEKVQGMQTDKGE